jgi:hypothetical protein
MDLKQSLYKQSIVDEFDIKSERFKPPRKASFRHWALAGALSTLALVSACGGGGGDGATAAGLTCDDGIKTAFKLDSTEVGGDTSVLLVKQFRKGDPLVLPNSTLPSAVTPLTAAADSCLVKLVVGPGFTSEPATADSWSKGIGIEVWLPEKAAWNERIRSYGSGGAAGGFHTDITKLGANAGQGSAPHIAAVGKGYVVSHSDHGHVGGAVGNLAGGQFNWAMKADGTPNTVLWQDYSERSMHVVALAAKALTKAYYGKAQKFAYWDGQSTGGRQGYKLVQKWPTDDGYLIGEPVLNFYGFSPGGLYPQIVMQRDLGHPIEALKTNFVSGQAVKACAPSGLSLILDPLACRYDPTKDAAALCSGVAGNGVIGTNTDVTKCVNFAEATAINKIWYGWTRDGSVPDPAVDNGNATTTAAPNQLWYGNTRGTNLTGINAAGALATAPALATANPAGPVTLSSDFVALVLQDPTYAWTNFTNATGNGQSKYLTLSYAAFADVFNKALLLNETTFSNLNTNDANLSAARDSGRKILHWHGLADEVNPPQGSIHYYTRVAAQMGGIAAVQNFDRLYLIPGLAHDSTFTRNGQIDPTTLAIDNTKFPTPQPSTGRDEMFSAMTNWVETGVAPGRIEVTSSNGGISMPLCVYPQKATYSGSGSVTSTSSYACLP